MKSRYIPFVHQPFCCVPAIIQMVLYRRDLKLLPQEEIGSDLGLIVPEKFYEILPNAKRGEKPVSGWGTQIQKSEFSLDSFFKKHNYPLAYEHHFPTSIKENLAKWIKKQLGKNKDLIACFNAKKLYDTGNDGGHICLIENIDKNNITLIETNKDYPKFRKVKTIKLIDSMIHHKKENLGGFWLIKTIHN